MSQALYLGMNMTTESTQKSITTYHASNPLSVDCLVNHGVGGGGGGGVGILVAAH